MQDGGKMANLNSRQILRLSAGNKHEDAIFITLQIILYAT